MSILTLNRIMLNIVIHKQKIKIKQRLIARTSIRIKIKCCKISDLKIKKKRG